MAHFSSQPVSTSGFVTARSDTGHTDHTGHTGHTGHTVKMNRVDPRILHRLS